MADPPPDLVLRRATLLDGTTADVGIAGGLITEVGTIEARAGDEELDLEGYLLSVAPVETHAHLDKAFLAERVTNRTGDLLGAIEAMVAARPDLGVEETADAGRAGRPPAGRQRLRRRADPRRHDHRPRAAQHRGPRRRAPTGGRRDRRPGRGPLRVADVGPRRRRPAGARSRRAGHGRRRRRRLPAPRTRRHVGVDGRPARDRRRAPAPG